MSSYPNGLSEGLLALSQLLIAEEPLDTTLRRVAEISQRTLDSCDLVGVTLLSDGKPSTAAFTELDAVEIDDVQYRTGRGPCVHSYESKSPMHVVDMSTDARWPEVAQAAKAHGVHSSLSMPLIVREVGMGALNLYSYRVDGFDAGEQQLALLFSTQAAIAIANAEVYWRTHLLTEQLREAMESRDLIGQAKGIVMASRRVTADEAFELLREASQRTNVKLRTIAEQVTMTGEIPGARPPS
jgi:GAF domain-containing protein